MRRLWKGGILGAHDRRALSVGALVIATAFAVTRGVPALRQWSHASVISAREILAEVARAEGSIRGAGASADTMRARSERLVALAPALLDGGSPATAGATLASLISGAAATADAKLQSVQVRSDAPAQDSSRNDTRAFARVAVSASVTADVRGLSSILLSLERGLTMLAVEELAVTQPEPGGDGARPEMLQVNLVVSGLALAPRRGR